MIDPHVHLRDWGESSKETLVHGITAARNLGFTAVFEQPNTNPPLLTRELLTRRLKCADLAIEKSISDSPVPSARFFYGVYGGLTTDESQIAEMVRCTSEMPRVVGLKMFTCASTGNLGVPDPDAQARIYAQLGGLGYTGVLAVHCEKESLFRPDLWDLEKPETHNLARPPEAETASVEDQIRFALDGAFKGTLHICHVSVPETLALIESARKTLPFIISTEITPHHALLWDALLALPDGICLKANPPLRPKAMQEKMLHALISGRISCIGSDHAPHTLNDKREKAASGIPSFTLYPLLFSVLKREGISETVFRSAVKLSALSLYQIPETAIPVSPAALSIAEAATRCLQYDFNYEGMPKKLLETLNKSYNFV